jgi:hypothetical protein
VAGLDLDTKLALMEQAVARAEGWVQGMLEISRTFLIAELDGPEAALAELSSIRERHTHHGLVLACIDDVRPALAGAAAAPVR